MGGCADEVHYTDDLIIRFDNHHGPHELHLGPTTFEIDFPGLQPLYRAWKAAVRICDQYGLEPAEPVLQLDSSDPRV